MIGPDLRGYWGLLLLAVLLGLVLLGWAWWAPTGPLPAGW
jgi:hypothetical protein